MRFPVRGSAAHRARGVTLIELMVSMLLGLIVIGGATSVIVASKQSYRTNEGLSQVQESARTAFELVSRDVRQAGVSGCSNNGRMANVLSAGPGWWQTWFGIMGYEGGTTDPAVAFGTAEEQRVAGTDSIHLQSIDGMGLSVEDHDPAAANFKISSTTTDIVENDILIVCDFDHAAMFQVTNYNSSNVTLVHNTGTGTVGNCSKGLGYPPAPACPGGTDPVGNSYEFGPNSQLARLAAVAWYIGNNGRDTEGGRSLYRQRLGAGAVLRTEEVVAGVTNMQIDYRVGTGNTFVTAAGVGGSWTDVNAVRITLTMDSADRRVSTDTNVNSGRLQRTFTNVVTLRNRVP